MAHVANTSQCFPSEPVRPDTLQILKLGKFARGVSFTQEWEVGLGYPVAVIGNLDQFETAIFEGELDGGRAGVEGIFNQLLDSICGSVDDLYCSVDVLLANMRRTKALGTNGTEVDKNSTGLTSAAAI